MSNEKKQLFSMNELTKIINKTRATIHIYMRQGMPYMKKGRMNFFDLEEVAKWLEHHKTEGEYTIALSSAQLFYPEDPLEQMKYLKSNITQQAYAMAMVKIVENYFSNNLCPTCGKSEINNNSIKIICIDAQKLVQFLQRISNFINKPKSADYECIANNIELIVSEMFIQAKIQRNIKNKVID